MFKKKSHVLAEGGACINCIAVTHIIAVIATLASGQLLNSCTASGQFQYLLYSLPRLGVPLCIVYNHVEDVTSVTSLQIIRGEFSTKVPISGNG